MDVDLRELGISPKFKGLRAVQESQLEKLLVSPHRVDVMALPTGTGKSLLGVVYARLVGMPAVILTSTRALQDQYQKDFDDISTDVRGMANYPCRLLEGKAECDVGPCLDGESCVWKEAGCAYFDRLRHGKDSDLVITNYAFWFAHQDQILGPRPLVILDEAHELDAELAKQAGVQFRPNEVRFGAGAGERDLDGWREWAEEKVKLVKDVMHRPSTTPFERRKLRNLEERLVRLQYAGSDWVWDLVPDRLVRFEPLDLSPYVERLLMRGADKVLMMSATVRPDMVMDLGLEFGFNESDSPFPVERRPIYWMETGLRLSAKTSGRQWKEWVDNIDNVIKTRLEKKGIVHTVSYARAQMLKTRSRFRDKMIVHEPSEARRTVEQFKKAGAPAILVSPVVHTGIDFPFDEARFQIIGKVPFPDTRSGIASARMEKDPLWSKKFAARTLVQMAGRVVRDEADHAETIIVDDNIKFLFSRHKNLFPRWWRKAFQPKVVVPEPYWRRER